MGKPVRAVIRVLCLAALIAVGGAWPLVLAAAMSLFLPWFAAAMLAMLLVKQRLRQDRTSRDVRFSRGVADELRAGASLRDAVAAAAEDIGEVRLARSCRIGRSYQEVAALLQHALPEIGEQGATAVHVAGLSGGRAAETFEALALVAADDQELEGEVRAATAQVRASAAVIAAVPVLLVVGLISVGRLSIVTSGGSIATTLLMFGGGLISVGWLVIWRMTRRATVH